MLSAECWRSVKCEINVEEVTHIAHEVDDEVVGNGGYKSGEGLSLLAIIFTKSRATCS